MSLRGEVMVLLYHAAGRSATVEFAE